jgi:hypothetical protein
LCSGLAPMCGRSMKDPSIVTPDFSHSSGRPSASLSTGSKTYASPWSLRASLGESSGAPMSAVLPLRAIAAPKSLLAGSVPPGRSPATSTCCSVHAPPLRAKTYAAPLCLSVPGAPTMARSPLTATVAP